jgi:hypothetical protein
MVSESGNVNRQIILLSAVEKILEDIDSVKGSHP